MAAAGVQRLEYVMLAVRGTVVNGTLESDLFKGVTEQSLGVAVGCPSVKFLNDVEGMALSLIYQKELAHKESLFIRLEHPKSPPIDIGQEGKPILLFTMGTGTGVSLILPYTIGGVKTGVPMILPTETWASTLSPDLDNPRQTAAAEYLKRKKKTKASLLKFLKGPSILDLYNFMREVWTPELYTGAE